MQMLPLQTSPTQLPVAWKAAPRADVQGPNDRFESRSQQGWDPTLQQVQQLRQTADPQGLQVRALQLRQQFQSLQGQQQEQILRQAFADKLDTPRGQELLELARKGQLPLPAKLRFVSDEVMQGAHGAYSPERGGSIFLNQSLASNPELLQKTLQEEVGHHLDEWLGGEDSRGDEGEIFQRGLDRRQPLATPELARLRQQNDHGSLMVDGRRLQVEFRQPEDWLKQFYAGKDHDRQVRDVMSRRHRGELSENSPEWVGLQSVGKHDPNWLAGRLRAHMLEPDYPATLQAGNLMAQGYLQQQRAAQPDIASYQAMLPAALFQQGSAQQLLIRDLRAGAGADAKPEQTMAHVALQSSLAKLNGNKVSLNPALIQFYAEHGGARAMLYLEDLHQNLSQLGCGKDALKQIEGAIQKAAQGLRARPAEGTRPHWAQSSGNRDLDSLRAQERERLSRPVLNTAPLQLGQLGGYQREPRTVPAPALSTMGLLSPATPESQLLQREGQRLEKEARASESLGDAGSVEDFNARYGRAGADEKRAMLGLVEQNLFQGEQVRGGNLELLRQHSSQLSSGQVQSLFEGLKRQGGEASACREILKGDFKNLPPDVMQRTGEWINQHGSFQERLAARERFPQLGIAIAPEDWSRNMNQELALKVFRNPNNWSQGDRSSLGLSDGRIDAAELSRLASSADASPEVKAAASFLSRQPNAGLNRRDLLGQNQHSHHFDAQGRRIDTVHGRDNQGLEYIKSSPDPRGGYRWQSYDFARQTFEDSRWVSRDGRDYMQERRTTRVEAAALSGDVEGWNLAHDIRGTWSPQNLIDKAAERAGGIGRMNGVRTTTTSEVAGKPAVVDTQERYVRSNGRGEPEEEVIRLSTSVGDQPQAPRWVHRRRSADGKNWDSQMFIQGTTDSITVKHTQGQANQAGDDRWQVRTQTTHLPETHEAAKKHLRPSELPPAHEVESSRSLARGRAADLHQVLGEAGLGQLKDNPAVADFLKRFGGDQSFSLSLSTTDDKVATLVAEGPDGTRLVLHRQGEEIGGRLQFGGDEGKQRTSLIAGRSGGEVTNYDLSLDPNTQQMKVESWNARAGKKEEVAIAEQLGNARNLINLTQAGSAPANLPPLLAAAMDLGERGAKAARALGAAQRTAAFANSLRNLEGQLGQLPALKGLEGALGAAGAVASLAGVGYSLAHGDVENALRASSTLGIDAGSAMTALADRAAGGAATSGRLARIASMGRWLGTAGAGLGLIFGGKDLIDGLVTGDQDKIALGGLGVAGGLGTIAGIWGTGAWFGPVGWAVSALATLGALGYGTFTHTRDTRIAPPAL